jgi:rubredoxin
MRAGYKKMVATRVPHVLLLKTHICPAGHVRVMDQYKCTKCGYVYLPESGDYTQGIGPNTPFEKLPDTWVCPRCGTKKKGFVIIE